MRRHRVVARRPFGPTPHLAIAAAALSALAVGGCGDPDTADAGSPLEELFGGNVSPAEARAQQLRQEEVVAQCMREAGWEYTPVDYGAQFPEGAADEPTGSAYGERYGYGIARSYELYEWPYIDADGQWVDEGPGGGAVEDPNQEYVASLTPEEMERYYADLHGDQTSIVEPAIDPVSGDEVYEPPPLEEQGCYGVAQLEVYGEQPWNDPEFNDRMNDYYEDLENDPRIEDAEIVWSDCMYEISEDYDFYGPEDMYQYVQGLFAEVKGQERVEVDPDSGEIIGRPGEYPEGGYSWNEGDDVGIGYAGTAKRLTEDEIADFIELEVAIWRDDQACLDESGLLDLRRDLEQELVDTIREEFPELLDDADDADDADDGGDA